MNPNILLETSASKRRSKQSIPFIGGFPNPQLKLFIITLLVVGICFRFINLDRKVYWIDEVFTSLRVSGYVRADPARQPFNGQVISVDDLLKYQRPRPESGWDSTIKSLVTDTPQHSPLYFLIARFWVEWFGSSIAAIRSLSAFISLLAFPCLYWLCLELFGSALVGWLAIAIVAVSPFHVLHSQDARPSMLWLVTILLSSLSLLRAMRLNTKLSWGLYAASLALGLYTFIFTGFVAIGHGLYAIAIERFRFNRKVFNYLLASSAALLAFSPWLWIIFNNLSTVDKSTYWAKNNVGLFYLIQAWIADFSRYFIDVNLTGDTSSIILGVLLISVFALFSLVIYSFYYVSRQTPKQVWLFLLALGIPIVIALVLPDLVLGGRRSATGRYFIPTYLSIQLAIAYLLAAKLSLQNQQKQFWKAVTIALFSAGVISCAVSSQAQEWWNKDYSFRYSHIAAIVNQAERPLLISDRGVDSALCLSHLLDPKVRLQLVSKGKVPQVANGFSQVFLYRPSEKLESGLKENYHIKPVYQQGHLFQLTQK